MKKNLSYWKKVIPVLLSALGTILFAQLNAQEGEIKMLAPDLKNLSDGEIVSLLSYISEINIAKSAYVETPSAANVADQPLQEEPEYSDDDISAGMAIFTGIKPLENGGPSCISCHHVTHDRLMAGGLLARDLTNAYERMGQAGIESIVKTPPFPAMSQSYNNKAITQGEAAQLVAFLHSANKEGVGLAPGGDHLKLLYGGGIGLIVLTAVIGLLWNRRKQKSVKQQIFKRQLKAILKK